MKAKTWVCYIKNSPDWYYVEAPSKRIARWCAVNTHNAYSLSNITAKDITVEKFKYVEATV